MTFPPLYLASSQTVRHTGSTIHDLLLASTFNVKREKKCRVNKL